MSYFFDGIDESQNTTVESVEQPTEPTSTISYRHLANFDKSRDGKLTKSHLTSRRVVLIVLMLLNTIMNVPVFYANCSNMNSAMIALGFYSLWGSTLALFAHIFAICATVSDDWWRTAYITTEISYSANFVIIIVFWLILVPMEIYRYIETGEAKPEWEYYYNAIIHALPFITACADLHVTDLSLNRDHTWITFIVVCPFYALANWNAAVNYLGKGTVYGLEAWITAPAQTFGYFVIGGLIQAAIFYKSADVIDYMWPKKEASAAQREENLMIDEEEIQTTSGSVQAKVHVLV